jgi:hypothetical protein
VWETEKNYDAEELKKAGKVCNNIIIYILSFMI